MRHALGATGRRHRDPRLDRRLPRALRLHRAHGAQGPAGGVAARVLLADDDWHLWDNLVEVIQTRDYMLLTAFINSIILTVASVTLLVIFGAMVGYVLQRRPSRWTPIVNFFVLAGLIIPPAVVPTIWVLQGLGLFKTLHGMILIEVAYGLSLHASCCSAPSSPRSRANSTRRRSSMAPGRCGCSSRSSCRCCGRSSSP